MSSGRDCRIQAARARAGRPAGRPSVGTVASARPIRLGCRARLRFAVIDCRPPPSLGSASASVRLSRFSLPPSCGGARRWRRACRESAATNASKWIAM
nr:hypothetical protein E2R29_12660 [Burkholderia pseudomallei]